MQSVTGVMIPDKETLTHEHTHTYMAICIRLESKHMSTVWNQRARPSNEKLLGQLFSLLVNPLSTEMQATTPTF